MEGSVGIATSEPLHSHNPRRSNVPERMTTSAPTRRHSLPEPKSSERKKRWAAMDDNLLPTDNFPRRSALLKACLDALDDASDSH